MGAATWELSVTIEASHQEDNGRGCWLKLGRQGGGGEQRATPVPMPRFGELPVGARFAVPVVVPLGCPELDGEDLVLMSEEGIELDRCAVSLPKPEAIPVATEVSSGEGLTVSPRRRGWLGGVLGAR